MSQTGNAICGYLLMALSFQNMPEKNVGKPLDLQKTYFFFCLGMLSTHVSHAACL